MLPPSIPVRGASRRRFVTLLFATLAVLPFAGPRPLAAQYPAVPPLPVSYSGLVVFGDSLSDTGNFAATTEDEFGLRYPSEDFNYADGRFTSGSNTDPSSKQYKGVWHEQLCQLFLGLPTANASLDGGLDYAFGDAETLMGQRSVDITGGITVHIDNLNRQITNYLDDNTPDPDALYTVWCGANDLFAADAANNSSQAKDNQAATTAAANVTAAIERLARAGAFHFLVNNLPPLGVTPDYKDHPDQRTRLNNASVVYRDALGADLDDLLNRLAADGVAIDLKRLDIYELFTRLTATNGRAYGFNDITNSAQDNDVNADRHLFWDGVHPTAAGHYQIAAEAFTVLTGIPVVEINAAMTHVNRNNSEPAVFFLTRTGPDVSPALRVYFEVGGTALPNIDYPALTGARTIGAGKRTRRIVVYPSGPDPDSPESVLALTLDSDPNYALPGVPYARVHFDLN